MGGQDFDLNIELTAPTERLLDYYKKKSVEWRERHRLLMQSVEECKGIVSKSAQLEENLLKRNSQIAQLQASLSELQSCLYQERERALRLTHEKEELAAQLRGKEETLRIVLHSSGRGESGLSGDERGRSVLGMRAKPRNRGGAQEAKEKREREVKEAEVAALQERLRSAEEAMGAQTKLLKDELRYLKKEAELREAEWDAERKLLHQRISCLNCQLATAKTALCDDLFGKLDALHKHDTWEREVLAENENLRKCAEVWMREGAGGKRRGEKEGAKETLRLRGELSRRDHTIEALALDEARLRGELERTKEELEEAKEELAGKALYWKGKLAEERRRRLNQCQGFHSDIKLLRERLHALERALKQLKLDTKRRTPNHQLN